MKKVLFLLLAILFLYSCGGGGGDNDDGHQGLQFIEISGGIPQNMQCRENVTFFDLDGDALKRTGFCSWENASDGLLPVGEFSSRALATGDINHDGLTDIAAISDNFYARPKTIRAFTGNGNFQWTDVSNGFPDMISGDHISLADINGDGYLDILVDNSNQSANSVIWFGNSCGGFRPGRDRRHHSRR